MFLTSTLSMEMVLVFVWTREFAEHVKEAAMAMVVRGGGGMGSV